MATRGYSKNNRKYISNKLQYKQWMESFFGGKQSQKILLLPKNVYLLKPLPSCGLSPLSTSRPTSPCAAHLMDSVWYSWTRVALTQNVIMYPLWTLDCLHFEGCLMPWVVANPAEFPLPGNWFTTTDFLENVKNSHSQRCTGRTASIRRYTEARKDFSFGFVCCLCWWPQRESILNMPFVLEEQTKQTLSSLCTGKAVSVMQNVSFKSSRQHYLMKMEYNVNWVLLEDITKKTIKTVQEIRGYYSLYFKFISVMWY